MAGSTALIRERSYNTPAKATTNSLPVGKHAH